jgi:hypothetical protein
LLFSYNLCGCGISRVGEKKASRLVGTLNSMN